MQRQQDDTVVILEVSEAELARVRHEHQVSPTGERLMQALVIIGLHVRAHHPDESRQCALHAHGLENGNAERLSVGALLNLDAPLPDRVRSYRRGRLVKVVLLPHREHDILNDKTAAQHRCGEAGQKNNGN